MAKFECFICGKPMSHGEWKRAGKLHTVFDFPQLNHKKFIRFCSIDCKIHFEESKDDALKESFKGWDIEEEVRNKSDIN